MDIRTSFYGLHFVLKTGNLHLWRRDLMDLTILVISDLHLGGLAATASTPTFQMCSLRGRTRLVEFIRWCRSLKAQATKERQIHLVLAGDIVDFLAEREFKAFTPDQAEATAKLERILEDTRQIWSELSQYVASGAALTLLLGNHDIELSLPALRQNLLDHIGPGQVQFLYDNQALNIGPVLIEHGNRHDPWNAVPHDQLRKIRSALSRNEPRPSFNAMPGSELVARVMNKIKAEYSFIDLMKPETETALPLLAVLNPELFTELRDVFRIFIQGFPALIHPSYKVGAAEMTSAEVSTRRAFALAESLAGVTRPDVVGALSTLKSFHLIWNELSLRGNREAQLRRLLQGLQSFVGDYEKTFAIDSEADPYRKAAIDAGRRGFKVVVFGHTHLAKRVDFKEVDTTYVNTGTWADLMRIPPEIFSGTDRNTRELALGRFADDLASNRVDSYRRFIPTFCRIDLDSLGHIKIALAAFRSTHDQVEIRSGSLWAFME
jgi:UDP-2,3-diacylglucosamine pyrophosphatase LpxH